MKTNLVSEEATDSVCLTLVSFYFSHVPGPGRHVSPIARPLIMTSLNQVHHCASDGAVTSDFSFQTTTNHRPVSNVCVNLRNRSQKPKPSQVSMIRLWTTDKRHHTVRKLLKHLLRVKRLGCPERLLSATGADEVSPLPKLPTAFPPSAPAV